MFLIDGPNRLIDVFRKGCKDGVCIQFAKKEKTRNIIAVCQILNMKYIVKYYWSIFYKKKLLQC